MSVVIIISDGNNERTSEYVPMVGKDFLPNNTILYTSSDGTRIYPYVYVYPPQDPYFGGAKIISNIYNEGIGTIVFDADVTVIGQLVFLDCQRLTSIKLPNTVTSIEYNAFGACTGLTSIKIPNSVTSIGSSAFSGSGLTSIVIPSSVISIGTNAFSCDDISSINVDSGNPVYDSRDNCNAIIETKSNSLITGCKNTVVPISVTSIGDYAFSDCSGLSSIELPESVTSIGKFAFSGCTGLTGIKIPNSVTSIGDQAFSSCSTLTYISCLAKTPCAIGSQAFNNTNTCPIYVPEESVDAFKVAEGWSDYADRIQANTDRFTSNVTWTLGNSAYTQEATVNGISGVQVLKLGTSSRAGEATVVIPKGTKSVSFYGVSWKSKSAIVQVLQGDTPIYTKDLVTNEGAIGNSPYTISVTYNDHYTFALPNTAIGEDISLTFTTTGANTRIILFGIKAE